MKGNDVIEIQKAVNNAINNKNQKPTMIVLDTVKGEGLNCVMEMKNNHCIGVNDELKEKMINEINSQAQKLGVEGI